jgi:hypothetical protein
VLSFPQVSPPKLCICLSSPIRATCPAISFFSISIHMKQNILSVVVLLFTLTVSNTTQKAVKICQISLIMQAPTYRHWELQKYLQCSTLLCNWKHIFLFHGELFFLWPTRSLIKNNFITSKLTYQQKGMNKFPHKSISPLNSETKIYNNHCANISLKIM